MTKTAKHVSIHGRWSWRIAIVGVLIATIAFIAAAVGPDLFQPVFWLGVVVTLAGLVGSATFWSQSVNVRYALGVISVVVGVLVIGYGVENRILLATIIGLIILFGGAVSALRETQEVQIGR